MIILIFFFDVTKIIHGMMCVNTQRLSTSESTRLIYYRKCRSLLITPPANVESKHCRKNERIFWAGWFTGAASSLSGGLAFIHENLVAFNDGGLLVYAPKAVT